jgi:hypothetical protein
VTACSDGPEPSTAALCAELATAQGLDESLAVADAEALEVQADALRRAASVAPPDIEPAVRTLSTTIDDLTGPLATATGDRRETLREQLAARQDQADALTAAGRSLSEWSATNCGLDLDSGTTVPTTPPLAPGVGGETTASTDEAPAP